MKPHFTISYRSHGSHGENRLARNLLLSCVVGFLLVLMTGCSTFRLPALGTVLKNSTVLKNPLGNPLASLSPPPEGIGAEGMPPAASGSVAEMVYYGTQRAKAQNGIVLHLVGDSTPIRVLPMPEGGQSVYVSQLLKQTGVIQKLGSVEATLFRHSSHSIGGVPMECKMSKDGQHVRPESDYALQSGDRLRVTKANALLGMNLVDMALGR